MPEIDRLTEIHISHGSNVVEVLIPMARRPSQHWQELFRKTAKATQLHVSAHERPERFWIQVQIPVNNRSQVAEIMDEVRRLINEVNEGERDLAAMQVAHDIRVWWAQQL